MERSRSGGERLIMSSSASFKRRSAASSSSIVIDEVFCNTAFMSVQIVETVSTASDPE